jgi:TonB family protein
LILVPFGFFDEVKQEDIRAALGHECAHIERSDFAWNLFYESLLIPLAYHPAAWLLRARIAESREQVCDAMAASRVNGEAAYAHSLLRLAVHFCTRPAALPAAMLGLFENNEMEKRIMNLTEKKRHYSLRERFLLLAPGVGLMALACVASCVLAFNVEVPAYGASYSQAAAPPASDSGQSALPPTDLSKLQNYTAANGSRMKVYKVGGGVSAPVALNTVEAFYSKEARRMKYQGNCLIAVLVDAQGNPRNPQVIRGLGMGLDKNAFDAVRKYKFKPAMKDGVKPVPVIITIEVNFRLY